MAEKVNINLSNGQKKFRSAIFEALSNLGELFSFRKRLMLA
jgi:hypothetical protein